MIKAGSLSRRVSNANKQINTTHKQYRDTERSRHGLPELRPNIPISTDIFDIFNPLKQLLLFSRDKCNSTKGREKNAALAVRLGEAGTGAGWGAGWLVAQR